MNCARRKTILSSQSPFRKNITKSLSYEGVIKEHQPKDVRGKILQRLEQKAINNINNDDGSDNNNI